jgi:hypothetical protein
MPSTDKGTSEDDEFMVVGYFPIQEGFTYGETTITLKHRKCISVFHA